jgi:hypothetical protein
MLSKRELKIDLTSLETESTGLTSENALLSSGVMPGLNDRLVRNTQFSSASSSLTSSVTNATRGADFNGDGKSDILWRNYATGENSVWLMNGTNLTSGVSLTSVSDLNWRIEGTGDFNSDGKTDLIWRNYATGENSVWLMNGTNLTSGVSLTSVSDLNWRIEGTGDFNSDGKSDIVWRNYATGQNSVWLMDGINLTSGELLTSVGELNWRIEGTGDFNSDGKTDLIWRNYATGQNSVWLMNGTNLTSGELLSPVGDLNWYVSGTGDFNSDGKSDIVWRNYATGQNSVWLMNGTSLTSGVALATSVSDSNWQIALNDRGTQSPPRRSGGADFNGDGKSDILWRNYATGENSVWLMDGTNLTSGVSLTRVDDLNWRISGTGDFNSDGKTDLIWRNYATGQNSVWLMDGTRLISGELLTSVGELNWRIEGTGDFNSDGKTDIVWRNYATGENSVWLMNGTSLTSGELLTPVGDLNWHVGGTGDFNSDGKTDIVWRNYATGENSVWLMNGTNFASGLSLTTVGDLNWQIALNDLATLSGQPSPTTPSGREPGNTLGTAEVQSAAVFSRNEQVSNADRDDFYRFTLSQSGIFTANLTGLSGDADARLIQDSNNNGAIDTGEILAWQWERGTGSESLRRFLGAGNYFLQVNSYNNQTANYNLGTNFTSAASDNLKFSIQVNFGQGTESLNDTLRNAVQDAARIWERVISYSTFSASQNLTINVTGSDQGGYVNGSAVLASAGPETGAYDLNRRLMPTTGVAFINTNSEVLSSLTSNPGFLRGVMAHEFGHVLGIGTLWENNGRNFVNRTDATYNANTYAGWAYGDLRRTYTPTAVPVTTNAGAGSDYSHWREQVFDTELMTHQAESSGTSMPLSQLTIATLRDIGWNVNYGPADAYSVA